MLYLNITILLLIVILTIVTIIRGAESLSEPDRKEHKLYFLYPLSKQILTITHLNTILFNKIKTTEAIKALSINHKPETEKQLYYYKRVSTIILIIFLFNLLSLMGQLPSGEGEGSLSGNYLTRPELGEGSSVVSLKVHITEDGETADTEIGPATEPEQEAGKGADPPAIEKQQNYSEEIDLKLPERRYSDMELEKVLKDALTYLETEVLGENTSADNIQKDLNFIRIIPDTNVSVEWFPDDYRLISEEGELNGEDSLFEAVTTRAKAVLTCQGVKKETDFVFTLTPKKLTEKELFLKKLYQKLVEQEASSSRDSKWRLPDKLDGYSLDWEEKVPKQNNGMTIFVLGVFAAVLIWVYGDKELENRMKKRRNQMLMDYPEIINKFTLLLNAGMTIKQAWTKIAEDYAGKLKENSVKMRFAYEEMLLTLHELKLGASEGTAYEQFGRRSGVLPYMKFGSLITQNLKKGSKGLTETLRLEAMEAFEERKELAKRLGEEAGTKLLGPMMIMLMIVLIIIMIPAFLSFGV
jgi:hypothetical protein